MKVIKSILDVVGNTPLIMLNDPNSETFGKFESNLFAKLEFLNPSGSVKDRIAKYMIEQAEKRGDLKPGSTIVEATSGNTGIAFSMVGTIKGYKVEIVMPETMTKERQSIMKAYGAEVILTPGKEYVEGSVRVAKELSSKLGWWMPAQFDNFDNVTAHRETTGKEIISQVPGGKVDAFIASVGTGGTLMGVAQALRAVNPKVKIIAAQPKSSQELTGGKAGKHIQEGIADGFVPKIVDKSIIDEVISVTDEDAVRTCRRLSLEKGLFIGVSSGTNVFAALQVAKRMKQGSNIVTILPDSADRYLSIGLFEKDADEVRVPAGCG